jgi:hypothetical protein
VVAKELAMQLVLPRPVPEHGIFSSGNSGGSNNGLATAASIAEIPPFRSGGGSSASARYTATTTPDFSEEDEDDEADGATYEEDEERRSEVQSLRATSQARAPSAGRSATPLPFAPAPIPAPRPASDEANDGGRHSGWDDSGARLRTESPNAELPRGCEPWAWGDATTPPPPDPVTPAHHPADPGLGPDGRGSSGDDEGGEYAHYRLLVFSDLGSSRRRVDFQSSPRSGSNDRGPSTGRSYATITE